MQGRSFLHPHPPADQEQLEGVAGLHGRGCSSFGRKVCLSGIFLGHSPCTEGSWGWNYKRGSGARLSAFEPRLHRLLTEWLC